MDGSIVEVGGLVLPSALLQAIEAGRWKVPQSSTVISDVFRDEPDGPQFYDLATIARQNQSFQKMSLEQAYGESVNDTLGIDPSRAVLIGDLGADMPITLDYRENQCNPRVVYPGQRGWSVVARDFETLCRMLDI